MHILGLPTVLLSVPVQRQGATFFAVPARPQGRTRPPRLRQLRPALQSGRRSLYVHETGIRPRARCESRGAGLSFLVSVNLTGEGLIGTVFRDPNRVAAVVRRGEAVLRSPAVQRMCTPAERAKREAWMRDRKAPAPQPTTEADDATYVTRQRKHPITFSNPR